MCTVKRTYSDDTSESSDNSGKYSNISPVKRVLIILTLIFYGQTTSICASIRYGFLVDSFSSRGISGTVYGAVAGSMFFGFVAIYFLGWVEMLMKKVNSRYLLAIVTGGFTVTTLITGLAFLIERNLPFIIVSTAVRICQGVLSYSCSLVAVDFINAKLSMEFDLINGLLSMGFFSGFGLAEVIGCVLYDAAGYVPPFLFASALTLLCTCLILVVIPKCRTYLASQECSLSVSFQEVYYSSQEEEDEEEGYLSQESTSQESFSQKSSSLNSVERLSIPPRRLTKFIIFPIIATALINANYSALQVVVTPFLRDEFDKSISYGGYVLTFVSVGMAIGSILTGVLLQRRLLNPYTIMSTGAMFVFLGIIFTFPPSSIPQLYKLAPITAFPGILLASIGNPLITISTLRVLYELQLKKMGVLTPQCVTRLTGIWLIGYSAVYYSGSALAGLLLEYLYYGDISCFFAISCLVSFLICIGLRILLKTKLKNEDDETTPLLS